MSRASLFLAIVSLVLPGAAAAANTAPCNPAQLGQIPDRPSAAAPATGFVQRVAGMDEAAREEVIRAELLSGNLPLFLRRLTPVTLIGSEADGRPVEVTLCVLPDYLALGSDQDFLHIPMGLETALAVATRFGFVLPTARMVDAIYQQAAVKLPPQPLPPGEWMRTTGYFLDHERRLQRQLQERAAAPETQGVGTRLRVLAHSPSRPLQNRPSWLRASGRTARTCRGQFEPSPGSVQRCTDWGSKRRSLLLLECWTKRSWISGV